MNSRRQSKGLRRILPLAAAFLLTYSALALFAYLPFQDNVEGVPVPARWPDATMTWRFNSTLRTNLDTQDAAKVSSVLSTGFDTWPVSQLNQQRINVLSVVRDPEDAPATLTDPNNNDCVNVISLAPSSQVDFPSGVIAFTVVVSEFGPPPVQVTCQNLDGTTTVKPFNLPSVLKDADMVFNPAQQFSTAAITPAGRFDLQSVATHEFGHALGLDHSGIAHTVMFPFGEIGAGEQRDLAIDDVVGIAFLYPDQAKFDAETGSISGRVTLQGADVFASHVVAIDAATGAAVIDGLTNPDGTYVLQGVPAGSYHVFALPLTGVYTLDNFSGWTCGYNENAPPCCDPADPACNLQPQTPTGNYTGKFY